MKIDDELAALALIQLVARVDADHSSMAQHVQDRKALFGEANSERMALLLAAWLLLVAEATRFPLGALLAAERRDLLTGEGDPPPVVA